MIQFESYITCHALVYRVSSHCLGVTLTQSERALCAPPKYVFPWNVGQFFLGGKILLFFFNKGGGAL